MPLAPWVVNEKWTFETKGEKVIATVSGRERCPWYLKLNPLWWLRNDYEQQLPDWYEPDNPYRGVQWALRNPLQNARLFILGWADRNYTVEVLEGRLDLPMLVQRDDIGETGYQKCRLTTPEGETRTFTSYCSDKLIYQWGVQPNGFYGLKVDR